MIEMKEPVKAIPSEQYSTVLQDANGVCHFWLPDGTYDGYDGPCKQDNKVERKPKE